MLAPPFPIMFLWNCLKMGTDREKLFSIYERSKAAVRSRERQSLIETNPRVIPGRRWFSGGTWHISPPRSSALWAAQCRSSAPGRGSWLWPRRPEKLIRLNENRTTAGPEKTLTSGNLSRTSLIFSPFWPMIVRWSFCSTIKSLVRSFSWTEKKKTHSRYVYNINTFILHTNQPVTILWTISMSSLRASWTPLGSPSIRTRPLRSESWGIRTDTLYCSLIRLTEVKRKQQGGKDHVTKRWTNQEGDSHFFTLIFSRSKHQILCSFAFFVVLSDLITYRVRLQQKNLSMMNKTSP